MDRYPRALGRLALFTLVVTSAGCAQLQWSSRGPGSPGRKNTVQKAVVREPAAPPAALPAFDAPAPFSSSERERIATVSPWVQQTAAAYQLDPDLISAIIWVESRFVVRAKSPAGARGLMQLMPATAKAMAEFMGKATARSYDPAFNIEAGSVYLLRLLDRYDGDETLALAAYNAGSGNVSRWMREDGALPPRSLEYVQNVQRARRRFVAMRARDPEPSRRTMLAAGPARPAPSPSVPPPPRRANRSTRPSPAPQPPARNPLAPADDVYRPTPPLEPPLADTPYPPRDDAPPRRPQSPVEPSSDEPPASPGAPALPSVLD